MKSTDTIERSMRGGLATRLRRPGAGSKMGCSPKRVRNVPNTERQPDLRTFCGRLGANVRQRRQKLGLSQPALLERLAAEGVEVSVQTLSAYEIGTRPIQMEHLPAFAKALNTTVRKLVPEC